MATRKLSSLDKLMNGSAQARFDGEVDKIWDNIYDMRTDPGKIREVTLSFKFTPNATRTEARISVDVKSKLAPPTSLQETVMIRQADDGSIQVTELMHEVPGQIDISGNETPMPRVITFKEPQTIAGRLARKMNGAIAEDGQAEEN